MDQLAPPSPNVPVMPSRRDLHARHHLRRRGYHAGSFLRVVGARCLSPPGRIVWFKRKKVVGSYVAFTVARRA